MAFPVDFAGRPYNTLTVPCELDMYAQLRDVISINFLVKTNN